MNTLAYFSLTVVLLTYSEPVRSDKEMEDCLKQIAVRWRNTKRQRREEVFCFTGDCNPSVFPAQTLVDCKHIFTRGLHLIPEGSHISTAIHTHNYMHRLKPTHTKRTKIHLTLSFTYTHSLFFTQTAKGQW